jgi:hypothetical protein
MVAVLISAVVSALTFAVCSSLGLPLELGVALAIVVLIGSLPIIGSRFGLRDY